MDKPLLGYFSHSTKTFNTQKEVKEYDYISKLHNCYIIAPNIHLYYKKTSIYNQYSELINVVDFIIVSAYNGTIGRNSYYEARQALEIKIPVFEIYPVGIGFKLRKVVSLDLLPVNNISSYAKLTSISLKNFSNK
jgi:hypothetical protein